MTTLFIFLVFPGFLFTAFAGMMASWLERKITARLQWRVGPPWYQSFADTVKLLSKETLIPRGAVETVFLAAPLIGFSGVILSSSILGAVNLDPQRGFVGDLIVLLYLLMLPSLSLLIGGAASRNTLAALGVSREMKLMIAYELPFVLAVLTPVVRSGGIITLGGLVIFQQAHGGFLWSPSGALAFIVALLAVHAKLGWAPFDIAEAETEINSGPLIEYSGSLLAVFRLTRMMLLIVAPLFIITIFAGAGFRGWGMAWSVLQYLIVMVALILVKNTNPRVRIDQALRFFWRPVLVLAAAAMALACIGY
ncbi:MAG: NADH-quinone oxidoreductase subunit H [Candidatus Aureabacteria bacterium]|nr:NADH-quinone oxidoreductase subunit H [Candidatus Auribacterota bacterium]